MSRPRSSVPGSTRFSRAVGLFAAATLLSGALTPGAAQQAVKSPHGPLPEGLDCSACHTAKGWNTLRAPMAFDHSKSGFVLSGAHAQAACAQCHLDLRFDGPQTTPDDCGSCHADVHEGRMLQSCSECHNTRSFQDVDGELIHARTSFPLTGAHRQLTCESCHTSDVGGAFTSLPTECVSCHETDYRRATTVDHVANGYPTDCTRCHTTVAWNDSPAFDHATVAHGFELVGAHAGLRCASCHRVPGMQPLFTPSDQNDCVACHQPDYDREHAGSGFPTTCLSCHNVNDWGDANFDHASTSFPLVGAHQSVSCATCHGPPDNLSSRPANADDCVACHQADYDKEHAGSSVPTTCADCHTQSSWGGAEADHVLLSGGFALTGPHATVQCTTCHQVPGYALLFPKPTDQNDCVSCHQAEYDAQHAGSGFPTTCVSCHQPDSWTGASFDHASTSFPLVGAHQSVSCATCHGPPDNLSTRPANPDDCVACHQADYDKEHAGSSIPTSCADCHTQTAWGGATADHALLSGGFALTGPHATAQCTACHAVPGYTLLFPKPAGQNDCVACHQADYDAQHAGSGFPTTCLSCHQADRWTGATVDHAQISGGFQLTGSHATAQCTACHVVPGYALLFPKPASQNDCITCHQTDYDGAHAGTGMPTDCSACHNTTAWTPSSFDHDAQYFPIYSGRHATVWSTCQTCHTNGGDLSTFSCIDCHEHSQSNTDGHHDGVSGYVYASSACYSCHPRGRS